MAQKGACWLLLLLLTSESLAQDLQTILLEEIPCRGRSCLLPKTPNNSGSSTFIAAKHPARNFPWGTGIRVGVDHRYQCDEKLDSLLLLKAVIEHVGPFNCTVLPRGYHYEHGFQRGIIDVFGIPVWQIYDAAPSLYPHKQANMCVLIKRMDPQRQTIIQTFTCFAWVAILCDFVSFSVVLRLTGHQGAILETFRTFITGTFIENKKRSIANGLSLLLSVFGIIMITAFSAKFMSFLAHNKEPVQPQTLEELNARVSTVYAQLHFKDNKRSFCDDDDDDALCRSGGLIDKIKERAIFSEKFSSSMDEAMFYGSALYFTYRRQRGWVDEKTGRSLTHMVPQCILAPAYCVFAVRGDWPNADRLSSLQQNAIEAGLNHKMKSEQMLNLIGNGLVLPEVVPSREPQSLALSAILEPVIVLCGGTALATAVFLAQFITRSRWNKLNNKL